VTGQPQEEPLGEGNPVPLPEPPPYEPDDALITELERGITPESFGAERH
jgi:hypothetical protein